MVKRSACLRAVAVCLSLFSWSGSVVAAERWQVDYGQSQIGFIASYDGIEFEGVFERWQGDLVFAPGDLPGSAFEIVVDMGSVDTRSRDRDTGIRSEEWFDVEQFGNARYVTRRFARREDGNFDVEAEFRIKGISKPLKSTFTWAGDGATRTLKGRVKVDRRTLGIGTGDWATDPIIGFAVTITYDIVLRR